MQHKNHWIILALIVILLQLPACTPPAESEKVEAASIEPIEGSALYRVLVTERAAERLDIQTTPVREEQVNGSMEQVIDYAAIIYDLQGDTWVYTSSEPLVFVRHAIVIDYIEGDTVVLREGPQVGTEVAIVGVAELYGIETGVGK